MRAVLDANVLIAAPLSAARGTGRVASIRSVNPGGDDLLALAADQHAVLVSGDGHLLALAGELPIQTQAEYLARIAATR